MNVVRCACGLEMRSESKLSFDVLSFGGHDPWTCSRAVGYGGRLDGATLMVDIAIEHLTERRSLSGGELAEVRRELSSRVKEVLRR